MPLSFYILIKTLLWIMGSFAFLLRPFDKLLAKLLDRGLEAGESYFSRETGEVSFAVSGGKKLTAPFEEFDAYVERVIEAGVTAEHDQRAGRNPRYWRDLNLDAWKQGEGAQWLKRQTEYPWSKRRCKLTPQLGKISMEEYRQRRPADSWPI